MANRNRKHKITLYLSDDEMYILKNKSKPFAELIKYAEQFEAYKPYHVRSKKSKNPDEYFRRHESELLLYDGAKNML